VRFLVDMPLSPALAEWLVAGGHDAVHASVVGLATAKDTEIVRRARDEGRVVVTADLDYPRILATTQADSPGLILFRGGNCSDQETVALLAHALRTIPHEELPVSIVVIEKSRIRRRRLPI